MFFEIWMLASLLLVFAAAFWHTSRTAFKRGRVDGMYYIMIKLNEDKIIDFDDDGNVKRPTPIKA